MGGLNMEDGHFIDDPLYVASVKPDFSGIGLNKVNPKRHNARRVSINHLKNTIMSKKTFQLVSAIIGGVQAIAVAVVTYTSPSYAAAINSAIVIAGTAAIEICNLFVKE